VTYFALTHLKEHQTPLKFGIIVALGGSLLSAISMSIFDWTIFSFAIEINVLSIFLFYFLEALIIGLAIGLIEGLYFRRKLSKKIIINDDIDDAFYESLKSK
jgi:hypothetical protein